VRGERFENLEDGKRMWRCGGVEVWRCGGVKVGFCSRETTSNPKPISSKILCTRLIFKLLGIIFLALFFLCVLLFAVFA
jgi:hypothetical protein